MSASAVSIEPGQFSKLFGGGLGDVFLLVTSPGIRATLTLATQTAVPVQEFTWTGPESRPLLIAEMAALRASGKRVSALWIADDEFVHFEDEDLQGVALGAISSFSTPFTTESLANSLRIVADGDYEREVELEETFLTLLDQADDMLFRGHEFGTEAVLQHQYAEHWFSLHGPLQPGQQAVLPTGELSCLVNASGEFEEHTHFALNGDVTLHGAPIIHRGDHGSSLAETMGTYHDLATMADEPAVITVADGRITAIRPAVAGRTRFATALEKLLAHDPRYGKIHEIGFGTNPHCSPLVSDNFFPNERHPGVHLGLGLGTFTQFHIDLMTTAIDVTMRGVEGRDVELFPALGLTAGRALSTVA
ncbi:hypothetical protein [Streptomyces sp. S.PB5]|uniref:hypothetical protein n=1 Tax=Streptomyces sp. S.PB5 TaxID=3020844 RepID=UPI0025B0A91B|nr:hypothetical protein [Streptomyces sp. S.PB5]MDN3025975.1 hypothetical protein [Streptomyces sp. S.PB5]